MRRLPVLLTVPALVIAALAIAPSAASAAPAAPAASATTAAAASGSLAAADACAPAPATAVVGKLAIDTIHESGLTGSGLTIGVISSSYDNPTPGTTLPTDAADDVASGALPGVGNPCGRTQPVRVLHDDVPSDDEGRAMLQIVHAIAPAADLVFTTGASDDVTFADDDLALASAIDDMIAAGVDVIVDDMMAPADLAYAPGFAAAAAERATDAGIIYSVAAGNLNHVGAESIDGVPLDSAGYSIGSWQTSAFRGTECPEAVRAEKPDAALECLDFDPSSGADPTDEFTLYAEQGVTDPSELAILQWSDAPYAVQSTLFAAFLDDTGAVTDTVELDDQSAGLPVAGSSVFGDIPIATTVTRSLVIAREVTDTVDPLAPSAPAAPLAVRFAFFDDDLPRTVQGAEHYESTVTDTGDGAGGTATDAVTDTVGSMLVGRAANPSAVTVAASSFFTPTELESYSAGGPQVRYFDAVTAVGTAPARLDVAEVREGPTVTGLDDLPTTFFGDLIDGYYLYPGTSAATPVVGTVLALGRQAAPHATLDELTDALAATATPLTFTWNGTTPAQTSGAGLIDPVAFIAAVREQPAPAPTPKPAASGAVPAELAATGSGPSSGLGLWGGAGLVVLGLAVATLAGLRRTRTHTRTSA
ncbi:S8 family serine peptidase [Herbiconiux daphne]|uniref:S8 family serine peptidase n=1 Tax=Herbiconiux daphne TaxID=2970914 RepID=A0ABT2H0M5_9MICO|nr:S8 family serine peptidase [Herbiconiux daphne]MCS5733483.1 S8 family serine peptidase [Herbiconiux daphne]